MKWSITQVRVEARRRWYDPKGGIAPKEFADMAVELFLHGFSSGGAKKLAPVTRREKA
ncbi:hypothetical protein [Bradyrhizobium sp.]|uniref:hypothetical protein n=1 Tax=Bradyrhizobium sp. TaxID=376 RepID=UPI0025BE7D23|nr:hypothetical protein [Bradyrhizobium sp.]